MGHAVSVRYLFDFSFKRLPLVCPLLQRLPKPSEPQQRSEIANFIEHEKVHTTRDHRRKAGFREDVKGQTHTQEQHEHHNHSKCNVTNRITICAADLSV